MLATHGVCLELSSSRRARSPVHSLAQQPPLQSFLSSLLITPLVFLLGKQDEVIKILQACTIPPASPPTHHTRQPYVDLAEGSATAERSLLLDYVTAKFVPASTASLAKPLHSSMQSVLHGTRNKHGVIVVSAGACLVAMLLQPLAGSLFTIRPTEVIIPRTCIRTHVPRSPLTYSCSTQRPPPSPSPSSALPLTWPTWTHS